MEKFPGLKLDPVDSKGRHIDFGAVWPRGFDDGDVSSVVFGYSRVPMDGAGLVRKDVNAVRIGLAVKPPGVSEHPLIIAGHYGISNRPRSAGLLIKALQEMAERYGLLDREVMAIIHMVKKRSSWEDDRHVGVVDGAGSSTLDAIPVAPNYGHSWGPQSYEEVGDAIRDKTRLVLADVAGRLRSFKSLEQNAERSFLDYGSGRNVLYFV